MRSNFIIIVALIIGGVWGYKSFKARPKDVPTMQLQNTDLSEITVPSSEPTVYVVWTTWCPACRQMLTNSFLQDPRIKSNIVLINDGEENELVIKTLKDRGYPFKALLDPQRNFARTLKVNSYPSFYIQDKHGRISSYEFPTVYRPDKIADEWLLKLYKD